MNLSCCAILFFSVAVIASHAAESNRVQILPVVTSNLGAVVASRTAEFNLTLTVDGVTFSNVVFGTVTPVSVSIRHSSGIEKIPLWKLPSDLQKRYGYDPQKATDWQKSQQQAAAAQMAAQEQSKRRTEWLKEHTINIGGSVTDVVEGKGVILSNEMAVEQMIRYGVTDPVLLKLRKCFLQCDTAGLVNGSSVQCSAYPDGAYSYTTVMGANMKVNRWVYVGKSDNSKGGSDYGYGY